MSKYLSKENFTDIYVNAGNIRLSYMYIRGMIDCANHFKLISEKEKDVLIKESEDACEQLKHSDNDE